jgi:signal transduction histidine kinase
MQATTLNNPRVFRLAGWMWLAYMAALVIVDAFIYPLRPLLTPIFSYHLISGLPALMFLALAYFGWLERHETWLVPAMILLVTSTAILSNYLFNLHLPEAPLSNLEGMMLRQLPVLLIGLILVAWHYNQWTMIAYSLAVNLTELGIVLIFRLLPTEQLTSFSFIILIRTVSFILVGIFINRLIGQLRRQQEALITANAQLTHYAQTLESLTISRERNRMSRELHDTVVHTLSGLSVQLETAKAYWEVDPSISRGLVDASLDLTRTGLQDTRRAIKSLRANPLEDLGLVQALRALIDDARDRGNILVEAVLPENGRGLSPDVEQCIYRIAQEALENVIHHARANCLTFRLEMTEDNLTLQVQDDGVGFDTHGGLPAGHFGLTGMKERAELAGGHLNVESRPNGGTTVQLILKGILK